jgi:hypothetical protein
VDVLSNRILLRPGDLDRSRRCCRDILDLAVYREPGPPTIPGWSSLPARGCSRSAESAGPPGHWVMLWIQARDVRAGHARLAAAGVRVTREPAVEPQGLIEMQIQDPGGVRLVLVEVPRRSPSSP